MKPMSIFSFLFLIVLLTANNTAYSACDKTVKFQLVGGISTSGHKGGGSYASADTFGIEEPFDVEGSNFSSNVGIGFYNQPLSILSINDNKYGECRLRFSFNVGYGSSLEIDNEALEAERTRDGRYTIGLTYQHTLETWFGQK